MKLTEDQIASRTAALSVRPNPRPCPAVHAPTGDVCSQVAGHPGTSVDGLDPGVHGWVDMCGQSPISSLLWHSPCIMPAGHGSVVKHFYASGEVWAAWWKGGPEPADDSVMLPVERWTPACRFQTDEFSIEWLEPPSPRLLLDFAAQAYARHEHTLGVVDN